MNDFLGDYFSSTSTDKNIWEDNQEFEENFLGSCSNSNREPFNDPIFNDNSNFFDLNQLLTFDTFINVSEPEVECEPILKTQYLTNENFNFDQNLQNPLKFVKNEKQEEKEIEKEKEIKKEKEIEKEKKIEKEKEKEKEKESIKKIEIENRKETEEFFSTNGAPNLFSNKKPLPNINNHNQKRKRKHSPSNNNQFQTSKQKKFLSKNPKLSKSKINKYKKKIQKPKSQKRSTNKRNLNINRKKKTTITNTFFSHTGLDLVGKMTYKQLHSLTNEEKEVRKVLKNRLAAKLSSERTKIKVIDLGNQVSDLTNKNEKLREKITHFKKERDTLLEKSNQLERELKELEQTIPIQTKPRSSGLFGSIRNTIERLTKIPSTKNQNEEMFLPSTFNFMDKKWGTIKKKLVQNTNNRTGFAMMVVILAITFFFGNEMIFGSSTSLSIPFFSDGADYSRNLKGLSYLKDTALKKLGNSANSGIILIEEISNTNNDKTDDLMDPHHFPDDNIQLNSGVELEPELDPENEMKIKSEKTIETIKAPIPEENTNANHDKKIINT
ncbi:x-box binding protein [Anaeramoeba flamelloides]|uniref:X-box binding protein n=1 Tax=Anaeramoeba flamelloides TaxID=1746091 RepID=A0AAV7Y6S2_9EUKA|nr:x-box binding protein [Anaeramoeba flamelloides]